MAIWQPAKVAYEFAATGMLNFPVPGWAPKQRNRVIDLARQIDVLSREKAALLELSLPADLRLVDLAALESVLHGCDSKEQHLLGQMIALQEELDWVICAVFGLADPSLAADGLAEGSWGMPLGSRPFEIAQARAGAASGLDGQALNDGRPSDYPGRSS